MKNVGTKKKQNIHECLYIHTYVCIIFKKPKIPLTFVMWLLNVEEDKIDCNTNKLIHNFLTHPYGNCLIQTYIHSFGKFLGVKITTTHLKCKQTSS